MKPRELLEWDICVWDTSAWHDHMSCKHDSNEFTSKEHQQWSSCICQSNSIPYKTDWILAGQRFQQDQLPPKQLRGYRFLPGTGKIDCRNKRAGRASEDMLENTKRFLTDNKDQSCVNSKRDRDLTFQPMTKTKKRRNSTGLKTDN